MHGLVWLLIALAFLLASPLFIARTTYKAVLSAEVEGMVHWMGVEHSRNAVRDVKRQYEVIIDMTSLDQGKAILEKTINMLPRRKGKLLGFFEVEEGAWTESLKGPIYSLYLFCWRLDNYLLWLGYVTPLLLALVWDGLMKRRVHAVNEHYWSPSHYNIVLHLILMVVAVGLMSLGVVATLPALLYPVLLVGLGFLVRSLLANLQLSA